MLESVELKNFRGHADTVVPLSRFTLLVGDNAVGKTNVLRAIELAGSVVQNPLHAFASEDGFKESRFLRSGASSLKVRLAGREEDQPWRYELEWPGSSPERPRLEVAWEAGTDIQGPQELGGLFGAKRAPSVLQSLRNAKVLRLRPNRLALPSTSDQVRPGIENDGTGLATAMLFLKATDLGSFQQWEQAARKVVPLLRSVSFERVRREETQLRHIETTEGGRMELPERVAFIADALLLQFEGTDPLPASLASEGTILVLGLLAFLHLPDCPRVVLLDDIDRALHPRAQGELIGSIRQILELRSDIQVVATTHSPYLADHFQPEEVVVLGRPKGGDVVARKLSEHPDQKLLKALTTGEFLSSSGPGWFA
jgi:predicted ATPase